MAPVRTDPSDSAPQTAPPDPSPSERITSAFEKLTASAKNINDVANALAQHVAAVERALKRLNVGVACWTKVGGGTHDGDSYWRQDVGYARVKGEWCLAIRTANGHESAPENEDQEVWPFNEAPRYLRVKAVDKLPDLIEALIEATDATAKRLADKVPPAQELAAAVNALFTPKKK